MRTAIKTRIALAVAAGAAVAAVVLTPKQRSELAEVVERVPHAAPIARELDSSIEIRSWVTNPDETDPQKWVLCRDGLLYGPGIGGVNPDGTPATCTPNPARHRPHAYTGDPHIIDRLHKMSDAEKLDLLDRAIDEAEDIDKRKASEEAARGRP